MRDRIFAATQDVTTDLDLTPRRQARQDDIATAIVAVRRATVDKTSLRSSKTFQVPCSRPCEVPPVSVDDYLKLMHRFNKLEPERVRRALLDDYGQRPRQLARILVALHAVARHHYICAERIVRGEFLRGHVEVDFVSELRELPGDGPIIVRLQVTRASQP